MPGEQSIQALQQRCSNLERDLDVALGDLRTALKEAKMCAEVVEIHRQHETIGPCEKNGIQCNCPVCNVLKTLRERDDVLKWASENVWSIRRWVDDGRWSAYCDDSNHSTAPTLYEALLVAYKEAKNIDESPKPT